MPAPPHLGDWEALPSWLAGTVGTGYAGGPGGSHPGQGRQILDEPGNWYLMDDDPAPVAPTPIPAPAAPDAPAPAVPTPVAAPPAAPAPGGGGGGVAPIPAPPSVQPLQTMSRAAPEQPGTAYGDRAPELDRSLTDRILPASSRALQQLAAQRGGRIY